MRGDQLARQWQLIQRLANSRAGLHLDQLAEELGCVRRTVYRDLDALMFAGFPVVSEKRDNRSYYRFVDTFQLRTRLIPALRGEFIWQSEGAVRIWPLLSVYRSG